LDLLRYGRASKHQQRCGNKGEFHDALPLDLHETTKRRQRGLREFPDFKRGRFSGESAAALAWFFLARAASLENLPQPGEGRRSGSRSAYGFRDAT
jgi:hypothetical protein